MNQVCSSLSMVFCGVSQIKERTFVKTIERMTWIVRSGNLLMCV